MDHDCAVRDDRKEQCDADENARGGVSSSSWPLDDDDDCFWITWTHRVMVQQEEKDTCVQEEEAIAYIPECFEGCWVRGGIVGDAAGNDEHPLRVLPEWKVVWLQRR